MRIMVYGSLKRNFHNHYLLKSSKFVGQAVTTPTFTMVGMGGFPGVIREGSTAIKGELYDIDESTLTRLDQLEGHPGWYERTPINVTNEDGIEEEVSIYLLPPSWLERKRRSVVGSGEWELMNVEKNT